MLIPNGNHLAGTLNKSPSTAPGLLVQYLFTEDLGAADVVSRP